MTDDERLRRVAAEIEKTAVAAEASTRADRVESRKEEFVRDIRDLVLCVRRRLAQYNRKLAEYVSAEADELHADVATIEDRLAMEDQITELALAVQVIERKLQRAQRQLAEKRAQV